MASKAECPACGSGEYQRLGTYKHDWLVCSECGTTRRHRRSALTSRFVPRSLAARILPARAVDMLYPVVEVVADDRHMYDYYEQTSSLDVGATKWAGPLAKVTGRLTDNGVAIHDATILDVSGGPGFLTQYLARAGAKRAIVTEFSADAVDGMHRNLGIEAIKFDYNSDRLEAVAPGPFDLVVVDYSINFCVDLTAFARSLAAVLRPGGHVYLSWVQPTLGCFLRWQFDEYTYLALYPDAVMRQAMTAAGFETVATFDDGAYDYRAGIDAKVRAMTFPFEWWYRARAPRRGIDRSLEQRHGVELYRLTPA